MINLGAEEGAGEVEARVQRRVPSEHDQIAFFSFLGLNWSSPESDGFSYRSRQLKKAI